MFNLLKLFGPKINTPAVPPPTTPKGKKEKPSEEGKPVQQEIFDQAVEHINLRLNISNWILGVAFFALLICFITLWFGYWQFASTSFSDYSTKIKELNDERYKLFENRLTNLENKEKTPSANEKK